MLYKASVLSPDRRIELSVPIWMSDVISESEETGFNRRLEYIRMGLYVWLLINQKMIFQTLDQSDIIDCDT